jgi:hypothetical protein
VINFIPSDFSDKSILRYDLLFEEGLKYAQKYSGKIWTDYNYHDPGVTFLEYLCYALTDLGYRTDFPIEDIFLFGSDDFDPIKKNLLFGPAAVFNTNPITVNDYRKLIIDRVKRVANAWVIPITDNKMGVRGLFEIFIECSEDLSDLELNFLKREVSSVFHAHRLIGHDLEEVFILKKVYLSIKGDVTIESDALGELVMAKIYADLDSYINPQVELHNSMKLWKEEGLDPELVFTGPLPKFGFIFENNLTPKVESIYLSRIKELIFNVEGVKEIRNLQLFKNGLPVFDTFVYFTKSEFPKIQYLDDLTEAFQTQLNLFKNNVEYEIDPVITKQLIASEVLSSSKFYHEELDYEEKLPAGRFSLEALQKHYPIHKELPEFFGIGTNGISRNASKETQASVQQLAAYLYFFEQMMASYLSQLSGLRNLFSVDHISSTYFNQTPSDIPNIASLLEGFEGFKYKLDDCTKHNDDFIDRRNRLLNHLLARFGERIDEASLRKMSRGNALDIGEEVDLDLIQAKINFLNSIVELGKNKAKAFDLKSEFFWDTDNVAGLEKRLALSLNFKNHIRRHLSAPLLQLFDLSSSNKEVKSWELETIGTGTKKVKAHKLSKDQYENRAVHFYGTGIRFIREIFEILTNEKSIICLTSSDNKSHYLLMQQRQSEYPFVLFESASLDDCMNMKSEIMNKFGVLDQETEGLHMIEHVLLRPLEPVSFRFSFLDNEGEVFLEGIFSGELKQQKSLGEDLTAYGLSIENYSIVDDDNSKTYQVFIYNLDHEPLAKLTREFNSKPGAKKSIEMAIDYFKKIESKEVELETVLEINNAGGTGQGFPSDFQFSDTLSFILPDWPSRFQKGDFVKYLKSLISENIMAHHAVNVYFFNLVEISRFEELYYQWLFLKNQDNSNLKSIDILSLQIIQMLNGLGKVS